MIKTLTTAVFYFVVACVVDEVGKFVVRRMKEKYSDNLNRSTK